MNTRLKYARNVTHLYAALIIGTGAGVLWARLPAARFDQPHLFWALLIGSVIISASKVHLPLGRGNATLSMSYITDFLALVLLGADEGMLVAGTSGATQCLLMARGGSTPSQTLFSAAALVITMQVTGLAAGALGGFSTHQPALALGQVTVVAAAVFFLCNSGLVSIVVALSRREPIGKTWYENFFWTAPACFIGAAIAVVLAYAAGAYIWVLVLAAGPLYVTFKAYRIYLRRLEEQQQHLKEVSDLHLASVEALARAIDARDQTIDRTRGGDNHIRRVQALAVALADAAGLPAADVEAVKVAALLHDIGKLAVPEHILTKPGRLTPKEFARVRIHPLVGAEIIKAVPFPYPVAPVILSHHERWDGSGYPDGLRGEAIPRGARVLAVVDYFDALTSPRPYHAAADRDEAIATLRAEAGQALDPQLVALFLKILESSGRASPDKEQSLEAVITSDTCGAPSTGFAEERGRSEASWVFHNISLATQEMRGLYDIAQTLGTRLSVEDTMALLSAKLNRLVPGSCWALFLQDPSEDVLRCRFATGLAADAIREMVIPGGEGTSGWVARHRTPVLNGRAAADFEAADAPAIGRPFQSTLSYPLVDGDTLIGTLTAYHVDAAPYCEAHRHVLDHVSSQAASVLRNTIAFERMRDVSITDPLTGLPNARALAAFLRERFADTPKDTVSSALIMVDLDDFKAVNDRHGHQTGDAALQAIATAIRKHVRQSDFCARYGGDEFVVVLTGCDRPEGVRRARELQDAVGRLGLASHSGAAVPLGISVGVGMFPEEAATIPALIAAADRRMYGDKAERRDFADSVPISVSA
jgi:diguanylate cyclase (GGDEF)-like protein/putative nucleotidyltransferase with HDIG domain